MYNSNSNKSYIENSNDFINSYILSPIYTVSKTVADTVVDTVKTPIEYIASPILSNNQSSPLRSIASSPTTILSNGVQNSIESVGLAANSLYENTLDSVRSENNILNSIVDSFRGNWFRIIMLVGILFVSMILIIANDVTKVTKQEKQKEKEEIKLQIRENMATLRRNAMIANKQNKDYSYYVSM